MNGRVDRTVAEFVRTAAASATAWGAAVLVSLLCLVTEPARAADPLLVFSITASGTTLICNTDCANCTIADPDCFMAGEEDLILCKPYSTDMSGAINGCHWSLFLDGDATNLQLNQQIRAVDIAPNGNITLVSLADTMVPGVSNLRAQDIAVFNPADLFKPYVGGGPYTDGTFKLYLDGNLTQQDAAAKPWDALSVMSSGTCEKNISATSSADYSCPIVGSLTSGSGTNGLDGVHFNNEDLLRCVPDAFSGGTVEGCKFEMFLDASSINGPGNGITSDIEALDFLSFDSSTMTGQMVFKMAGGSPPGFPAHNSGKDLLLYNGTFGAGNCSVTTSQPCAGSEECPMGETCNTGSCAVGGAPCATDPDCASGVCNVTRTPVATVTKFFDGVAVGLTGSGQNIEAFAILPDDDGDGIPNGADNCPNANNPPSVCSGGSSGCASSHLSADCPMGETCVQPDSDHDGVGDACDQCNGRPDPGTCDACPTGFCPLGCLTSPTNDCSCGDGITDFPSEQCDLGSQNGQPGSPCSATCHISGKCTGNSAPCTVAATDCPSGQGCCGNDLVEGDEQCDDGNAVDNDVCHNNCTANASGTVILGCEDLTGPNIIAAGLKNTKIQDTADQPDFDRWKTKGGANFFTGQSIDPDSEPVTIIFNNTPHGLLFESTLAAGNFIQSNPSKLKWKFKSPDANVPGSPSWRKGKFSQKTNQLKFGLDGRNATLFTAAAAGTTFRQTVRVGDVCITAVLTCEVKSGGKVLKCTVLP